VRSGQYQDEVGQASCKSCPAGQYRSCLYRDNNACLQAKPVWGAHATCAGSAQYCGSYADVMLCCPAACGRCSGGVGAAAAVAGEPGYIAQRRGFARLILREFMAAPLEAIRGALPLFEAG
jgi:hypothetical protein